MPELQLVLQLVAKTLKSDWELLWQGFIRKTKAPGMSGLVIRERYTLEGSTKDAFDNSGANAYSGPWPGYDGEPKYAKMKNSAKGGNSVLVWEGSKDPLRNAFEKKGHPNHTEKVTPKGMTWGAVGDKGKIAARLADGGFYQPWDKKTINKKRPAIRVTEETAKEVARGMQTILRGRLGRTGFANARKEPSGGLGMTGRK
jgi:hypothetical protein